MTKKKKRKKNTECNWSKWKLIGCGSMVYNEEKTKGKEDQTERGVGGLHSLDLQRARIKDEECSKQYHI